MEHVAGFAVFFNYDVADSANKLNRMGKMNARAPLLNGQAGMLSGSFAV